jgi:uncharacterized protein (TIGR04168 family)
MGEPRWITALIGDLHSSWDEEDVTYFNRSSYELLLFTGDLGGSILRDGRRIAKSISGIARNALVLPGNNDAEQSAQIAAELTYRRGLSGLMSDTDPSGESPTNHPRASARTCGFSAHPLRLGDLDVTIIAGRPFALGGSEFSFSATLERNYGVKSLEESASRLKALVDRAETEHLIFFGHNGPSGLGATADSPWGNDFRKEAGDWGDQDLAEAIAHARHRHRRPIAVIAGHMHWPSRSGGSRCWQIERDGTLYVNPARVPRIYETKDGRVRHHVALSVSRDGACAKQMLVRDLRLSEEKLPLS